MDFDIYITEGGRWYVVHIRRLSADKVFETFEVSTKANTITVRSNRPLLRSKRLLWKKPEYNIVTGSIRYQDTFKKITRAITDAMEDGPPDPPEIKPPPGIGEKLVRLGYNYPRQQKGESNEEHSKRCENHKAEYIRRNWSLLQRMTW